MQLLRACQLRGLQTLWSKRLLTQSGSGYSQVACVARMSSNQMNRRLLVCPQKMLRTQQLRNYAPAATQTSAAECWNCRIETERRNHMICTTCGHLQDVNSEINYFDLLNFPKGFGLEPQELTRRFRQLQTLVHPDKFSNKNSREQTNSADWSALINRAYKTLSVPIDRGQYILHLQGQQIPQDNSALDKAFLMEMMERNEQVEEAETRDQLQQLNAQIAQELQEKVTALSAEFQANALEAAKAILVEMKYLISIQKSIKAKLQDLMAKDS